MSRLLVLLVAAACIYDATAIVNLNPLIPYEFAWQPPVTDWLLSSDIRVIPAADRLAWRKIGKQGAPNGTLLTLTVENVLQKKVPNTDSVVPMPHRF